MWLEKLALLAVLDIRCMKPQFPQCTVTVFSSSKIVALPEEDSDIQLSHGHFFSAPCDSILVSKPCWIWFVAS